MCLVSGPTPDILDNKAWTSSFYYQAVCTLAVILPSSLRRHFCWAAKKHIGNGTARKPAFLLPILHTPCEKEVCLKSSPALKNRNGHGTSQCSLNWDWILTFFEWDQTSSLEHFWALDLGSFLFRNTTFWFASLGPLRSLQIKPNFTHFPAGLLWFLSLEFTKERPLCFLLQKGVVTRIIWCKEILLKPWSEMFYFKFFCLLSCQYAFSRSSFIRLRLCYDWSWLRMLSFPPFL